MSFSQYLNRFALLEKQFDFSSSHWRSNFNEDTPFLCALDRIFDDAIVFNFMGESFQGKKLEAIALQTSRVKISIPAEKSTP